MRINEFAKPYKPILKFFEHQIGSQIHKYEVGKKWKNSIFICGISTFDGKTDFLDAFRDALYSMSAISAERPFVDIGNVVSLSKNDRDEALKEIQKECKKTNSILLLIAEEEDVLVQLIVNKKNTENILKISPFVLPDHLNFDVKSGLGSITYIGVQSYFNFPKIPKHSIISEFITVGQLRDDIMEMEPFFRMGILASFNLNAVRKSDYSLSFKDSPNGLYAEEICQLGWFAGNSDSIQVYCLNNLNTNVNANSDIMLAAQLFWYILTGITKRYDEDPSKNTRNFKEYYIENNKTPEDLVFYKSMKSEKFWVKYGQDDLFIPCSKKDMNVVLDGYFPDRLLKKITVNQKKQ
jgi:formiminoglutamase